MLEGMVFSDAALDFDARRPADHDGHRARSESLFCYFRLEDQAPEHHLLRFIDKHVSFEFVRQQLKDSYSKTRRPSIDSQTAAAHAADRLSIGHHQRAQTGGRVAHASSLALVYRSGPRP